MDTEFKNMIELHKKYKSGTALEILQEAILSGSISGEITQNEFASSLETSRMPVREALIALEFQGLVEKMPSQHVKIVSFDEKSVREIFNNMAFIEIEILKSLTAEELKNFLSRFDDCQIIFHKSLIENLNSLFTKKTLEILIDIYLAFVLENSMDNNEIKNAFKNLIRALKNSPVDFESVNECYKSYAEILSNEFMKIRKENNLLNAER